MNEEYIHLEGHVTDTVIEGDVAVTGPCFAPCLRRVTGDIDFDCDTSLFAPELEECGRVVLRDGCSMDAPSLARAGDISGHGCRLSLDALTDVRSLWLSDADLDAPVLRTAGSLHLVCPPHASSCRLYRFPGLLECRGWLRVGEGAGMRADSLTRVGKVTVCGHGVLHAAALASAADLSVLGHARLPSLTRACCLAVGGDGALVSAPLLERLSSVIIERHGKAVLPSLKESGSVRVEQGGRLHAGALRSLLSVCLGDDAVLAAPVLEDVRDLVLLSPTSRICTAIDWLPNDRGLAAGTADVRPKPRTRRI